MFAVPVGGAGAPANKRRDSDFYQQRLPSWQPVLSPCRVAVLYGLLGISCAILGALIRNADGAIVEYDVQYDGAGTAPDVYNACHIDDGRTRGLGCTLTITVDKLMQAPVYVYYELINFHQNHRRYVKSRSDAQLAGTLDTSDPSKLGDCDPLRAVTNTSGTYALSPCGLIANSYFNDTFSLSAPGVTMLETDISWASDRRHKFKAPTRRLPNVVYIDQVYPNVTDVTDEHFIVWMRTAALPAFRKLYGRIETDISAGTVLSFRVGRNFPVASFGGEKMLVVSTNSILGGKNPFVGPVFMVIGAVCCALAAAFLTRQWRCPPSPATITYLVWRS